MKRTGLLALILAGLSLASCGGYYAYSTYAPPPVRVETFGVAPGPGYVWVGGNWAYRGNNYVWTQGRWARPPRGRHTWESGRWEQRGNRHVFIQGHWR